MSGRPVFGHDPDGKSTFVVDWLGAMPAGASLVSSVWVDVTAGLTVEEDTVFSTTRAQITVTGGSAGTIYEATNRVTWTGGDGDDQTIKILVRER